MAQGHEAGLGQRIAWHARAAWRTSRVTFAVATLGGLAIRSLLPVHDAWLAVAVAGTVAFGALVLLVLAGRGPGPSTTALDPAAALESASTLHLAAHALMRAALLLGGFALGLAVGDLAGLGPSG